MNAERPAETHRSAKSCSVSTPERNESREGAARRTPFSKFRKVHSNFKSPIQETKIAKVSPAEEVAELELKREQLNREIAQLESENKGWGINSDDPHKGYRIEELEHHIDMLHEYNNIKDIGQSLLGRIAALRANTTRDLYSHFGLELDD